MGHISAEWVLLLATKSSICELERQIVLLAVVRYPCHPDEPNLSTGLVVESSAMNEGREKAQRRTDCLQGVKSRKFQ